MSKNYCPDCGDVMTPGQRKCRCGTQKAFEDSNPDKPRCQHPSSPKICGAMAFIQVSVNGTSYWVCESHHHALNAKYEKLDWRDKMVEEKMKEHAGAGRDEFLKALDKLKRLWSK